MPVVFLLQWHFYGTILLFSVSVYSPERARDLAVSSTVLLLDMFRLPRKSCHGLIEILRPIVNENESPLFCKLRTCRQQPCVWQVWVFDCN